MDNYLVMDNVTKVYDNGIMANNKVCFSARQGEIHAICGENGAGKSTLMKLLFGIEQPNEGRIVIKGEEVNLTSPTVAIKHGIGMVHQHFMLVPSLTVAENVMLGVEPTKLGVVFDKDKAAKITAEISKKYELEVDPLAKVEDISVGLKQKVEIIKALVKGAEILILDEPTAVLTPQETGELFIQLKNLRAAGHTIIFISHKLDEVKELCDRVTILRHGRTVGVYDAASVSKKDISRLMVGVDVELTLLKTPAHPKEKVLSVSHLDAFSYSGKQLLKDVSFDVRAGEILGVAGVEGNGQRELINAITGLGEGGVGTIELLGKDVRKRSIRQLRELGMVHIPEDRMVFGVAREASILENLIADKSHLKKYNRGVFFNGKAAREDAKEWVERYQVLCSSEDQPVRMLSGGNIQKVVVAREFSSYTTLLVCDQPTRGIDVGATEFIRRRLLNMRDEGKAVLLVSADLGEVMNIADSLIVMYEGEIVAYFPTLEGLTEEELGFYMLGVKRMSKQEIGGAVHA